LCQAEPIGGAGYVSLFQDHVERDQQVQIGLV
jgi:hypothetical protein